MYNPNRTFEYNNSKQMVIINAEGHVAGKLATVVAKHLLEEVPVTVIHCENVIFTGPLKRDMGRYKEF